MNEIVNALPFALPWCLFLLCVLTQPPQWIKPVRRARRIWAQTHLLGVVVASVVTASLSLHPWYSGNVSALSGAALVTYIFVQASQTDLMFRKASEAHLMYAWALFIVAASIVQDVPSVISSLTVLFLTALTRRWWAGDATALCVAISCSSPMIAAHPEVATVNLISIIFVLLCSLVTALYKSSKRPIAVPLIPIVLAPFTLMPLVYFVAPAIPQL